MVNGAETYIPMSMTTVNTERVSLNAVKGIVSNVASVIMSAVTMPMLIFFGGGNSSTSKSYFMVALILQFYRCHVSTFAIFHPKKLSVVDH